MVIDDEDNESIVPQPHLSRKPPLQLAKKSNSKLQDAKKESLSSSASNKNTMQLVPYKDQDRDAFIKSYIKKYENANSFAPAENQDDMPSSSQGILSSLFYLTPVIVQSISDNASWVCSSVYNQFYGIPTNTDEKQTIKSKTVVDKDMIEKNFDKITDEDNYSAKGDYIADKENGRIVSQPHLNTLTTESMVTIKSKSTFVLASDSSNQERWYRLLII